MFGIFGGPEFKKGDSSPVSDADTPSAEELAAGSRRARASLGLTVATERDDPLGRAVAEIRYEQAHDIVYDQSDLDAPSTPTDTPETLPVEERSTVTATQLILSSAQRLFGPLKLR